MLTSAFDFRSLDPADYTALDIILDFNSVVTELNISVIIQSDVLDELNERFLGFLEGVNISQRVDISPNQSIITIIDDDSKFFQ